MFPTPLGRILYPISFEQITVSSTGVGLTPPNASAYGGGPIYAYITVDSNSVRWRDDGTDPTAAVGHTMAAGERLAYDGDANKIKFIRVSADATLNVSYYTV